MNIGDSSDPETSISAYAKLEFGHFSFFVQTLTLVIGRKAKRDDNVDVHLGMSKAISRVHAKIYYQFDAMSWEVEVLGRNGAFVNEHYVEAGQTCHLTDTDKLQIADTEFVFLLPEGATLPQEKSPSGIAGIAQKANKKTAISTIAPLQTLKPVITSAHVPLAPHHLMEAHSSSLDEAEAYSELMSKGAMIVGTSFDNNGDHTSELRGSAVEGESMLNTPRNSFAKSTLKRSGKYPLSVKNEDVLQDVDGELDWSTLARSLSSSPEPETVPSVFQTQSVDPKTDEERKAQEEELALQHAAQLLHQERLARQAQEEEEGLILPPAETDLNVIANLQKPTASYATMIYNAITSHEKKKMTLAQIYSWICIYHPYYRYVQNGWQNSIRHNLSLNKAFMKVSRTDDEPGKGSFWAVDPESEMLFEGGVYKKKPPRSTPLVSSSRGSAVVIRDGKLTVNPNIFVGDMQGKAEEVLNTLHFAVQKQLGHGKHAEQASQLSRILALALATQLRQNVVSAGGTRQMQHCRTALPQPHKLPLAAQNVQPGFLPNSSNAMQSSHSALTAKMYMQTPTAKANETQTPYRVTMPLNSTALTTSSSQPLADSSTIHTRKVTAMPSASYTRADPEHGNSSPKKILPEIVKTSTTLPPHNKRSSDGEAEVSRNKVQKLVTVEGLVQKLPVQI